MAMEPAARYLEMQVMTATREQLLLLLFDGAIRFAEQGRESQQAKEFERSTERLQRAQEIMLEVMSALDHSVGDELYIKLIALYQFCHSRLLTANLSRKSAPVDDALQILRNLRAMWGEAVARTGAERREAAPAAVPQGSLSVLG